MSGKAGPPITSAIGPPGEPAELCSATLASGSEISTTFGAAGIRYCGVVMTRSKSRAGPAGRVLAVEPQTRLHPVLQRNFALNACARAELAPYAVSDRPGEAALHLTPGVNNSASSLIRPTRYPLARQTVQCLTLAEIFGRNSVDTCDLLKIDIEGWEYEAVLGSPDLFRSGRVKALALELHPPLLLRRGLDSAKITTFLAECGYRPWSGSPNLVLVHAPAV